MTAPAVLAPPKGRRLPIGFAVELDPTVRRLAAGGTLLGGAPLRLLRLSAAAGEMLGPGSRLTVTDGGTGALARRLLETGVAHPRPAATTRDPAGVTVVIPVRDRPGGLDRLLAAVRATTDELAVIVVDDGSVDRLAVHRICRRHGAALLRRDVAGGPAAARNCGLAAAGTPVVALLDSDCAPTPGWLPPLLAHLDDPLVAAVAPRIVALPGDGNGWLTAYERACSSLDLGPRESLVAPRAAVPYVPSAALLVRRTALGSGYDESMHVAEDVDLVWRLAAAGWQVRYEPRSIVGHEHRTRTAQWVRRRAFYGSGAAALARRHASAVAPIVLSRWSAAAWVLVLTGHPAGGVAGAGVLATAVARLARAVAGPGRAATPAEWLVAGRLVGVGTAAAGRQLATALTRHYWPLSLLAAIGSRRARRALLAIAVAEGLAEWVRTAPALPAWRFLLGRRLDDLAYGAGLWAGAVGARSARCLLPAWH